MRTSYFVTPKHFSKICDIAVESVVQLYTNTKELYHSNLFSYITNNNLYIIGDLESKNHFSDIEIKEFVKKHIEVDLDIHLALNRLSLNSEYVNINGTFLGYSNNENPNGIPFEHLSVKELAKKIYESINEPLKVQMTINGIELKIAIDTNYKNHSDIVDLIQSSHKDSRNWCSIVNIQPIKTNSLYKSGELFISNSYGPRVPYSNTNFVGLDIYTNAKCGHIISKKVSDEFLKKRKLNYSLIELTYEDGNENPIQKALKGNNTGINIEYGTFFENEIPFGIIDSYKKIVINDFKNNPTSLIDIAKWGMF